MASRADSRIASPSHSPRRVKEAAPGRDTAPSCHREANNAWLQEVKSAHPSGERRERNVEGDRERGRDDRTGGHPIPGGADGPSGAVGGDSPAGVPRAGADRGDRPPAGPEPPDGPALSAGADVDALPSAPAHGHRAGRASDLPAGAR